MLFLVSVALIICWGSLFLLCINCFVSKLGSSLLFRKWNWISVEWRVISDNWIVLSSPFKVSQGNWRLIRDEEVYFDCFALSLPRFYKYRGSIDFIWAVALNHIQSVLFLYSYDWTKPAKVKIGLGNELKLYRSGNGPVVVVRCHYIKCVWVSCTWRLTELELSVQHLCSQGK